MPKYIKSIIILSAIILVFCDMAVSGGLSTRFVEVKMKDLEPGRVYSVKEKTNLPLLINNTTETNTFDIEIAPEMPVEYNLVSGYEPIPDLSWVIIENNSFKEVGPGQSAETDIMISIPKGKKYLGKKYQVYIYSHTAGGANLRLGIMSRILIEIASAPSTAEQPVTAPGPVEKKPVPGKNK